MPERVPKKQLDALHKHAELQFKVKLGNRMWRIYKGGVPSLWYGYTEDERARIHLKKSYATEHRELDTAIHEALHACFPYLTEEVVTESAGQLARYLRRLGYRKL